MQTRVQTGKIQGVTARRAETLPVEAPRIEPGSIYLLQESMDPLGIEPRAFRMGSGCDTTTPCAPEQQAQSVTHRKNMLRNSVQHLQAREVDQQKWHADRALFAPTLRKWGWDDLEHFFEQEHITKISGEKKPLSSRPAFSKVTALPGSLQTRAQTGKIQGLTARRAETLPVEVVGG